MGGVVMHDTTSYWQRNYNVISPTNPADTVQSNVFKLSLNPYDSRKYVLYGGQGSSGVLMISGESNSSLLVGDSTLGIWYVKSTKDNGNYTAILGNSEPNGSSALGSISFAVKDGAITNYVYLDKYGLHPAIGTFMNLGQGIDYGYGNAPWDTTFTNFIKIDSLKTLVSAPTYTLAPDANGVVSKFPFDGTNFFMRSGGKVKLKTDGSDTLTANRFHVNYMVDSVIDFHGMKRYQSQVYLASGDSINFFAGAWGSGTITGMRPDNSIDFMSFKFDVAGNVTSHSISDTTTSKTRLINKLCVYPAPMSGNRIIIKNYTGDYENVLIDIKFSIPL
jgi:hypothetical protein